MIHLNKMPQLELARKHAEAARVYLCNPVIPEGERIAKLSQHIDDCIYHPTTGLLANHTVIPGLELMSNKGILKHPQIKYLTDILKDRMKELYPKTGKVRKYIIEHDRIDMNSVKPSQGYNIFDKIKMILKR